MNVLNQLQKALNEADENSFLSSSIQAGSDIKFSGQVSYTGDSKIELSLSYELPLTEKHLISAQSFDNISEEQFNKAVEKIQTALDSVSEEFALSLKNKLASYGLEGEQNG